MTSKSRQKSYRTVYFKENDSSEVWKIRLSLADLITKMMTGCDCENSFKVLMHRKVSEAGEKRSKQTTIIAFRRVWSFNKEWIQKAKLASMLIAGLSVEQPLVETLTGISCHCVWSRGNIYKHTSGAIIHNYEFSETNLSFSQPSFAKISQWKLRSGYIQISSFSCSNLNCKSAGREPLQSCETIFLMACVLLAKRFLVTAKAVSISFVCANHKSDIRVRCPCTDYNIETALAPQ